MLILTRRIGEKIYIGDDVILTVNRVFQNGDIKFSLKTPDGTKVNLRHNDFEPASQELVTKCVDKVVIKYKRVLSRLAFRP